MCLVDISAPTEVTHPHIHARHALFFVPGIVKDISINKTVAHRPVRLRVFLTSENRQTWSSSCEKDSLSPAFFDGLQDRDASFTISYRY